MSLPFYPFIPAKAGTQAEVAASILNKTAHSAWVPAFAGMKGVLGWEAFR